MTDQPAPITSSAPSSYLERQRAALDALMALNVSYLDASRAIQSACRASSSGTRAAIMARDAEQRAELAPLA